ncbi:hypothetical protein V757_10460 [Pelistega indica]|uniref:TNase-like domain-containing protein n=1 Tax=Pelistega indica TaxID=1414851 RepID=V8FXK7_9BURK|nr:MULTISPECIES: thermonuclease family protein [Pelistega]ETD68172.1 hypothetical protein V757_10460 [Pelistega indica]
MLRFIFITLFILFSTPSELLAKTYPWLLCRVVNVADGDTITCLENRTTYKIRLNEIDAPEKGQAFGQKSRQTLRDKIIQQTVNIEIIGKDRYHRYIGNIYLNNENINLFMVREGYAWAYRKYLKHHYYLEAEALAKAEKKGLWLDGDLAIYPETFRKNQREKNRKSWFTLPW